MALAYSYIVGQLVQMEEKTVDDYLNELQKTITKMGDDIENRKKDFRRAYLKHVGNFLRMIDVFLQELKEAVLRLHEIPKEDIKLVLEPKARIIKENYYALIKKVEERENKDEMILEAIVLDLATSINYYECLPLVITNKDIKSAKAYPLIVKQQRDPQDPVVIMVNPKISNNLLLAPLIGHEVAHLLEKSHRDEKEKNHVEELCCDYLASIFFGVSYAKAQLIHVSKMSDDELYNINERLHPPREYRVSQTMVFLDNKISGKVNKQVKHALNKVIDEWDKRLTYSKPPRKYGIYLSAIDINVANNTSLKHVKSIIKQYSISMNLLIHNKHSRECPLSLIYKNSINYIINGKEDKTIKSKILDYAKALG